MAGFLRRYVTLSRTDHEGAAGRFDDIVGDYRKAVDLEDAFDLHEQPVKEPEVAARDAGNRGDRVKSRLSDRFSTWDIAPLSGRPPLNYRVSVQGFTPVFCPCTYRTITCSTTSPSSPATTVVTRRSSFARRTRSSTRCSLLWK